MISIDIPYGRGAQTLALEDSRLAGILRPDAGTVALDDLPFSGASEATRSRVRRERFGFVVQDHQTVTALGNILATAWEAAGKDRA